MKWKKIQNDRYNGLYWFVVVVLLILEDFLGQRFNNLQWAALLTSLVQYGELCVWF